MLFTGTSRGEGGRRFRDERHSVRLRNGGALDILKGGGDRQGTASSVQVGAWPKPVARTACICTAGDGAGVPSTGSYLIFPLAATRHALCT